MKTEIENVSGQLYGFMEEIDECIEKIQKKNANITYNQGLQLAALAVQNIRNDVLWKRIKQLNDSLETLGESISDFDLCGDEK